MLLNIVFLVVGLVVIILGANWLVDGASSIARRFNISEMVIGLTIVGFGTSTPELTVSVSAALSGSADVAIGNVVGSNIANILLILGISAIIAPLSIQSNTKWKEIPLSLLAAIVLVVLANDIFLDNSTQNLLTRIDGIILLLFFAIFLHYSYQISTSTINDAQVETVEKHLSTLKSVIFIVVGLAALIFGGKYMVIGAIEMARYAGLSESFIGLTIVAVGTSLPEMATSIVAARKGKADIAVGNVVGSNIFNIFFILGVASFITPIPLSASSNFDILMVIFASLLLFASTYTFKKKQIDRSEGIIYVLVYVAYIVYLISQL